MISDEKRREVARKLREVEILEYNGDKWCDEGDVLDALGLYNEDDPSSCNPDKVALLADLIDRPRAIDLDDLLKVADELENKFFVVYDSHGEIDHADCFVERIKKAIGE